VRQLELESRAEVWVGRAESFGRAVAARGTFDLVVARGFGPPAVTAECAAPFLQVGGRLAVSDPPGGRPWPPGPLLELGLRPRGAAQGEASIMVLEQVAGCPERFPRRSPAKRPLF